MSATSTAPSPTPALRPPLSVPEAIEARRSIRRYAEAPVPQADLDRLLELMGRAPSSANVQPWRVVVVRDAGLKAQLRAAAYGQAQVEAAPVVLVLTSDIEDAIAHLDDITHPGLQGEAREAMLQRLAGMFGGMDGPTKQAFGVAQTYLALGYLSLAATSMGYATSIMGGFDAEAVRGVLGIPGHVAVAAVVALGVPDEPGFSAHRHALDRFVREAHAA